jgi:hypothetical protein
MISSVLIAMSPALSIERPALHPVHRCYDFQPEESAPTTIKFELNLRMWKKPSLLAELCWNSYLPL